MTEQRYRVSSRPQRTPGAIGGYYDWFDVGVVVTRAKGWPLDSDGEWRVYGPDNRGRGFGYIRPDALDLITESTDTNLPDEKFLDAVLALYAGSWVPSGAAIRKIIDQARKIQGAIEP